MKKPWLAALLNVVPLPLGFGYLYLGRLRRFIIGFLVGVLAMLGFAAAAITAAIWALSCVDCEGAAIALAVAGGLFFLLLVLFTAWDAWGLAAEHNEELSYRQGRAGTAQGAG